MLAEARRPILSRSLPAAARRIDGPGKLQQLIESRMRNECQRADPGAPKNLRQGFQFATRIRQGMARA